ncbi:hypothetical protein BSKO_05527 [Bryopsis sp. KO-2023]|nr:hypothetical protein BSKO_05527 [Bryopsis sp. KO-2023]
MIRWSRLHCTCVNTRWADCRYLWTLCNSEGSTLRTLEARYSEDHLLEEGLVGMFSTVLGNERRLPPVFLNPATMSESKEEEAKSETKAITNGNWHSGLCGCYDDTENCLFTICCPAVAYGLNVRDVYKGESEESMERHCCQMAVLSLMGCWFCAYRKRSYLRTKYNLPEQPCNDCCTHCWCHTCALCQEAREIKYRNSIIVTAPAEVEAYTAPAPVT